MPSIWDLSNDKRTLLTEFQEWGFDEQALLAFKYVRDCDYYERRDWWLTMMLRASFAVERGEHGA